MQRIDVGVLGATGMVGQQFIAQLARHPWFRLVWVGASERSAGQTYRAAAPWRLPFTLPDEVGNLIVQQARPGEGSPPELLFSAMDASVAGEIEEAFAKAGHVVVSNARNHRMSPDVPLLIPEINHEHLGLIETQQKNRGFTKGFIVTNPNCAVIAIAPPLAGLHRQFGIESAVVTTLQAISGAGYPGVASFDIVDNVVPYIAGEEPKVETEAQKILGKLNGGSIHKADFAVSAQCFRVNVLDGHTASVRVNLKNKATLEEVLEAMGSIPVLDLHSSPKRFIEITDEPTRPQPRIDRDNGAGMTITVGRVFPDNVFDYRFVTLSHNTVRGAAGAAILNAELLVEKKLI